VTEILQTRQLTVFSICSFCCQMSYCLKFTFHLFMAVHWLNTVNLTLNV